MASKKAKGPDVKYTMAQVRSVGGQLARDTDGEMKLEEVAKRADMAVGDLKALLPYWAEHYKNQMHFAPALGHPLVKGKAASSEDVLG